MCHDIQFIIVLSINYHNTSTSLDNVVPVAMSWICINCVIVNQTGCTCLLLKHVESVYILRHNDTLTQLDLYKLCNSEPNWMHVFTIETC